MISLEEEKPAIDSTTWNDCSILELYSQMDELNKRYNGMIEIGNIPVSKQLAVGIERLKLIIDSRDVEKAKYVTFLV